MINDTNVEDLWDDMDRLNALYEELLWHHKDKLEFIPNYEDNTIIIRNVSMNGSQS
jgi:hypothetical protein|tara:strand:+ start:63 stop:230 length:168 start_codon:yes stop_codon:yes gene_type:complete